MKKLLTIIILTVLCGGIYAQDITADTVKTPNVIVNKDPRLDILAKAEADINNMANRFTKGYRLFVLKTNNRDYAMKVRTYLLQNFPEEKVIMSYQAPFIKMKFGNFIDKKDAEKYRDMIVKDAVVTGGVYIVPETVEVDPSKIKENDL